MFLFPVLFLLTGAVLPQAAHASAHCGGAMSCADGSNWNSQRPVPMSVAAEAAEAPDACVRNVLGLLGPDDVPLCEAFAASHDGTRRQRAMAWLNLGHYYFVKQDHVDPDNPVNAFSAWDKASAIDPLFAEPLVAKGDTLLRSAKARQASSFFEEALRLEPGNWHALLGLSRLRNAEGKQDEALSLASRAVNLAPHEDITHQIYARMLECAGRVEEARAELLAAAARYNPRVIRRLPGLIQESPPWEALAAFENRQHRPQQAIDAINHMIGLWPESETDAYDIYSFRATQYETLGKLADAATDYEHAARLLNGSADGDRFQTRAAMLRARIGQGAIAADAFREIIHSAKLRAILRIQVFLRNQGFDEVEIDGKPSAALEKALDRCLAETSCTEGLGQPI